MARIESAIVLVLMQTVSVLMPTRFWNSRQTQISDFGIRAKLRDEGSRYVVYVHGYNCMFMPTSFYVRWTDNLFQTQSHQFLANRAWRYIRKLTTWPISCFNKNASRLFASQEGVLQIWMFKLYAKVIFEWFTTISAHFSFIRGQNGHKRSKSLNTCTVINRLRYGRYHQ